MSANAQPPSEFAAAHGSGALVELPQAVESEDGAGGGVGGVLISRAFAGPSSDTFDVPPIAGFVRKYLLRSKVSIDPFARNKRWATHTNDLNPDTAAQSHMDAEEFLRMLAREGVKADLVIFDPPYSPRQIAECYAGIGRTVTMQDTQNCVLYSRVRSQIPAVLAEGGVVLSFGWNSNGMGRKHGFEIVEILMVAHGAAHNDTICVAERRVDVPQSDFFGQLGGGGRGVGDTPSTAEKRQNREIKYDSGVVANVVEGTGRMSEAMAEKIVEVLDHGLTVAELLDGSETPRVMDETGRRGTHGARALVSMPGGGKRASCRC